MLLLFPCNDYSLPALYYAISFFHSAEQYSSYLCPIKFLQDKVNYAVSEREERVTDVTTLTRMTGCSGMYWAGTGLY